MTQFLLRLTFVSVFLLVQATFSTGAAPSVADDAFAPRALGMQVPVVSRVEQLDEHVGRLVAVRGIVSNTKPPHILGVQINADDTLRGREAYAIGILARWTVTKADGYTQNDGPGTKYMLYFDLEGRSAEAKPIPGPNKSESPKRQDSRQSQIPAPQEELACFRAKVTSFEIVGKRAGKAVPVGTQPDLKWLVGIEILSVERTATPFDRKGTTTLLIHSPSRFFGQPQEEVVGKLFSFRLFGEVKDGVPRYSYADVKEQASPEN